MDLNIDYKSIGERVKFERERRSMTRDEFSEVVGISSVYLSQIERSERVMSLGTFIKVASALQVSLDYLIYGEDIYKDLNRQDIINIVEKSSNKELKIISDLIRAIFSTQYFKK